MEIGTTPLTLLSLYALPDHRTPRAARDLLTAFITDHFLLCGDFNGHHPHWDPLSAPDRRGSLIASWADDCSLLLLNDGSLAWVGGVQQRNTAIDLAFASPRLGLASAWSHLPVTYGSDHFPCRIVLQLDTLGSPYRASFTTRTWNTKLANWFKYFRSVQSGLPPTTSHMRTLFWSSRPRLRGRWPVGAAFPPPPGTQARIQKLLKGKALCKEMSCGLPIF